jgi:hypothetical protein
MILGEQKPLAGVVSMHRTVSRPVGESRFYSAFHSKGAHHVLGIPGNCDELCKAFDKVHVEVVTERDEVKRAEKTNRMIELVSNAWMIVPVVEGMANWVVNSKKVGAFKAIPGHLEFGDSFERMPRPEENPWR